MTARDVVLLPVAHVEEMDVKTEKVTWNYMEYALRVLLCRSMTHLAEVDSGGLNRCVSHRQISWQPKNA